MTVARSAARATGYRCAPLVTMRILFLERTPSLRAVKLAAALPGLELGYGICGTDRPDEFARVWDLGADPALTVPGLVAEFRPDVIHSLDGLGMGCGVPVVLDLEQPAPVDGAAAVIARSE